MDKFEIGEIAIHIDTGEEVEILSGLIEVIATNVNTGLVEFALAYKIAGIRPDFLPGAGMACKPENLRKKHPPSQDISETRAQDKPISFNDLMVKLNKETA